MGIFSDILSKNRDFYGQKKATKKPTSQKKITKKKNQDLARIAHQIMIAAPHLCRSKFSTTYPHIHNKERSCSAPRPPGGRAGAWVRVFDRGWAEKKKVQNKVFSGTLRHRRKAKTKVFFEWSWAVWQFSFFMRFFLIEFLRDTERAY